MIEEVGDVELTARLRLILEGPRPLTDTQIKTGADICEELFQRKQEYAKELAERPISHFHRC